MDKILVLKTIRPDGNCYYDGADFVYPEVGGEVVAPKWEPTDECDEYGLYGLGYGVGSANYLSKDDDALWLVIEVAPEDYHQMDGKCKFAKGTVVYRGAKEGAIRMISDAYPDKPVVYAVKSGGGGSTLTGGDYSTLTGGDGSTLTGGHRSTLTGGDWSTLTGGHRSTLTGGDGSTLTGGDGSTLTGGHRSTLTGGDYSTLCWKIWDGDRYRLHVRYVGEDGIRADTPYRWVDGEIVEVEK